ncbi:phenylacetate--CoA ligase family protein [Algoriphagus sp.]|uniref:phenylacetate--CoA ligase family protein n=1 Tax=Algoriphagus sp. TaxID=1872435 RepID=UPI003F72E3DC
MSILHENIFTLGAKRRNPSIFKHFKALKESENYSRERLQELNFNKLRDLLVFANKHSQYYQNLFKKVGFDPTSKFSHEDFAKIPITTKQDLIVSNQAIHTSEALFKKRFFCETSGTTGQILTFFRDENWDSFNRASIWRGYSWYGANPWDKRLYFWGYNTAFIKRIKLRFMDYLVNRSRIFDYDTLKLQKMHGKMRNIKIIEGYSSMIYELANTLKNETIDFPKLKLVKGTSEKVFPHYQEVAKNVYGKTITNEYGSAEAGIIAFECPHGQMHINMEGVLIEQDPNDDGIIVTNLMAKSFPIVRYKLGDAIRLADPEYICPCGMEHPVILEVTGRIGKKIEGIYKSYPSLTLYYIFKNIYFNKGRKIDFQVHQYEKGKLQIWVKEPVTEELSKLINSEVTKYYQDITIEVLEMYNFRQQAGKLRDFISHIK